MPATDKMESEHDLDCLKCGSHMTKGTALVGAPRGMTIEGEWPTKLRDCLKCHSCGYSETIDQSEIHYRLPQLPGKPSHSCHH